MASMLSDEQKKIFREAFDAFDEDKSGSIDGKELKAVLQKTGQTVTDAEVAEYMEEFDTDKNGTIEFDEFLEMMARQMSQSSGTEVVAEAFKVLDADNDGSIDVDELLDVLKKVKPDADRALAETLMAEANTASKGKMSMEEFREVCKMCEEAAAAAK